MKGAKVSRACAERARSRNALGLKSARARNAYGSSPRFGFNSREQHADEDTTGAIRLAGSGFGPRERALCGNLNFFPRLVAECQILENRETNIPYENFRHISLFEAFARPALLHLPFLTSEAATAPPRHTRNRAPHDPFGDAHERSLVSARYLVPVSAPPEPGTRPSDTRSRAKHARSRRLPLFASA